MLSFCSQLAMKWHCSCMVLRSSHEYYWFLSLINALKIRFINNGSVIHILGVKKHFTLLIVSNSKSMKLILLIFAVKIAEQCTALLGVHGFDENSIGGCFIMLGCNGICPIPFSIYRKKIPVNTDKPVFVFSTNRTLRLQSVNRYLYRK